MTMLRVNRLSARWDGFAIDDISFTVAEGDYFVLLGPSGGGKTLVLEILAGLHRPAEGTVTLDGEDITGCRIQDRNLALVYQDRALFPHLTVHKNIAYGLAAGGVPRVERLDRAAQLASLVGVAELLHRRPGTLSGGEAQRVALARALAREPKLLLLDEPLSALDISAREKLRALLRQLHRAGNTIVHVTHDFEEAVSLASHVAIMAEGKIVQMGTRDEVFLEPRSRFVARFTGVDNFIEGEVTNAHNSIATFVAEKATFQVANPGFAGRGYLLFRRRDLEVSTLPPATATANVFAGKVIDLAPTRSGLEVRLDAQGLALVAHVSRRDVAALGLELGMQVYAALRNGMGNVIRE
jgi:ABC-type Fe3+/spermidine/putrescine transport system ATPase subunit